MCESCLHTIWTKRARLKHWWDFDIINYNFKSTSQESSFANRLLKIQPTSLGESKFLLVISPPAHLTVRSWKPGSVQTASQGSEQHKGWVGSFQPSVCPQVTSSYKWGKAGLVYSHWKREHFPWRAGGDEVAVSVDALKGFSWKGLFAKLYWKIYWKIVERTILG